MAQRKHLGRWLVFGIIALAGIAIGTFLALRPMITMRPPRVISRRSDDALYHAMPPTLSGEFPPADNPDRVDGNGTATSPEGFPVKANRRSGIYHLPGDLAYERTIPSLYFRNAEAAEAAGFRHALR